MAEATFLDYLSYAALIFLTTKLSILSLRYVYRNFLASPLNVKKFGQWALVTGSTDGIGKAYAFALAKKGLNIVLVSRSPYKLQNIAAEIEDKYKVQTKIIDVDFANDDSEYMKKIEKEIEGLEIGVLVNNVGMSYEYPEEYLQIEGGHERVKTMMNVNITSMNALIRLILPQMVERRRGAVINLSSVSCVIPSPMYSVYSGCKAYVHKYSRGLSLEYKSKGITVQCVMPGYVVSKMSKLRKPTLMAPTPEKFVKSALNRIGVQDVTTGYWSHDLMVTCIRAMPTMLRNKVLFDQIQAIRKRALRKKEKEAKAQ